MSKLTLGYTQPPDLWVPGFFPGVITAEVKNYWSCTSPSSVHFHGMGRDNSHCEGANSEYK